MMCHFFRRADIMLYGDLTVRNRINDMYELSAATRTRLHPPSLAHLPFPRPACSVSHRYEIGAVEASETKLLGAADFPDTPTNRRLIDECAEAHGWAPYRSLIVYLAYHLQEADLVLI